MLNRSYYIDRIEQFFPQLELRDVQFNQEGMINVSVIINQERVFRFPRDSWAVPLLRNEKNALDLIRPYVDIPIPRWDYYSDEMVSYPFILGRPLLTDDLSRMSDLQKDKLAETLAQFLKQIHTIPMEKVSAAAIQPSDTVRSTQDWLTFLADVEEYLFPLMWADGREWVRRHFAPLLADSTFVDYQPSLMHGDLATYHILCDDKIEAINGIIDFGTVGIGDLAADFAVMINQYGESFLRRMSRSYPEIKDHIQRARFWAGTLELQWVLVGLKHNKPDMFTVHLGRARDMKPVEDDW